MIKVNLISLGCSKNQVDSEIMAGLLRERPDLRIVNNTAAADVIIINTCGFIQDAKEESIETIIRAGQLKEAGNCQAIIVTGCLAQRYKNVLLQELPEINAIVGTGTFDQIGQVLDQVLKGQKVSRIAKPTFAYQASNPRLLTATHYAYLKISEGCNNNCTYCSIPQIRGPQYSREMADVKAEVTKLVAMGVQEIILIAQDLTSYGLDLYGQPSLPALIKEVLKVKELKWLRLMYNYPENISDQLIDLIAHEDRICNYLDIPIQHSSDRIRHLMKRRGKRVELLQLISKLRKRVPGINLRTSLIVGFPGEDEHDFMDLLSFVKEVEFERLGVFKYSAEEDTAAFKLPHHLSAAVKEERHNQLMEIQQKISYHKNQQLIGQVLEVIIDQINDNMALGRSRYDAPEIDNQIYLPAKALKTGDLVQCIIKEAYEYDLIGANRDEFTK
ncbi:MAG: 30S ribosomal protein S12 methylthiotransferase RimO [Halanaerobiales bacterium]|nr:30S ribosomal protein S12 methylthiotransferase RimO [Halanaerobiales bacterium]